MLRGLIPVINVIKANKKLKDKNSNEEVQVPENIFEIDLKYLEEDYKSAVETKNRFEDKAKTIIAALTIAITLILNLSKIIEIISDKYDFYLINILLFILAILAIIYMLMAGILAIQVLIKENILYPISLLERTKQDKVRIYVKTQLNVNQNLIRNNIIFSSYESIRNSVVCLVIIFILASVPYSSENNGLTIEKQVSSYNIYFGNKAMEWFSDNGNDSISFDNVISFYNMEDSQGQTKYIYDKENQLLVAITQKDGVYFIDEIISNIEKTE